MESFTLFMIVVPKIFRELFVRIHEIQIQTYWTLQFFDTINHSWNLFFLIWYFNLPQELFNNIFEPEPCSFFSTSHFSNKNFSFQRLSNSRSIEYSFFEFTIGQLGQLKRYKLKTLSLFILKLTSEICLLLRWSDLKTEFGASKSMKIRCSPTNCCSNSFVLKLCYEIFSNVTNLAWVLNSAAWNP